MSTTPPPPYGWNVDRPSSRRGTRASTHSVPPPGKEASDYFTAPPKPKVVYDSGPCSQCNLPLGVGTEIVACLGMMTSLILIVIGGVLLGVKGSIVNEKEQFLHPEKAEKKEKTAVSFTNALEYGAVTNLIRGFYDLILYFVLFIGAKKRARCILLTFLWVKVPLLLLLLGGSLTVSILYGHGYLPMSPIILVVPELYYMWVVFAFAEELMVVGVMGGEPKIKPTGDPNEIFEADVFTSGIYSPDATASGDDTTGSYPDYRQRALDIQAERAAGNLQA